MKAQEKRYWAEEMALVIKDFGWEDFIKESIKQGHIDETKIDWTYDIIIKGLGEKEMWELAAIVRDEYGRHKNQ
jgi:hypothetical protein